MNNLSLSKSEREIMELMWSQDEPLTSTQIIDMSVNRSWKKSYIHLLINSLIDKGFVEIVGFVKTTKNYARTFKAAITKQDYFLKFIKEDDSTYTKVDFICSLLNEVVDPNELDEYIKVIQDRKSSLVNC